MKYILALLVTAITSLAAPVTFQWDDQPPGTPEISGYRIYQVIKSGASGDTPETITYQQANTEPIPPTARQWTTENAAPGTTWTIRAYNIAGEGPDSGWIEIPSPPTAVPGFRTLSLVVESSPDLFKWGTHAILSVAAVPPQKFYRLRW